MIEIVKLGEAPKKEIIKYLAKCSNCQTEFTYTADEVKIALISYFVRCPLCDKALYHSQSTKFISD